MVHEEAGAEIVFRREHIEHARRWHAARAGEAHQRRFGFHRHRHRAGAHRVRRAAQHDGARAIARDERERPCLLHGPAGQTAQIDHARCAWRQLGRERAQAFLVEDRRGHALPIGGSLAPSQQRYAEAFRVANGGALASAAHRYVTSAGKTFATLLKRYCP